MAIELPDIWTISGVALALVAIAPAMTSVPSPSHWEFWISRICFAGAALLFLVKLAIWGAADLNSFRFAIVAASGAIIAVALAAAIHWVGKKEESTKGGASLDQTVQFSCDWSQLPTVIPQHKLFELELVHGGIGGAFIGFSQQPGTPINLVRPETPTYAYRCRFNNFGSVSIANLTAEMAFAFKKVEKEEHGTKSGEIITSHKIRTPEISLGPGQFLDFYVRNYSTVYAQVMLPSVASGQIVGSNKIQTFRLIPSQPNGFGMPPFEPPKVSTKP